MYVFIKTFQKKEKCLPLPLQGLNFKKAQNFNQKLTFFICKICITCFATTSCDFGDFSDSTSLWPSFVGDSRCIALECSLHGVSHF